MKTILTFIFIFLLSACASKRESAAPNTYQFSEPPSISDLATGKVKPPTGEELQEGLANAGHNWFFGSGLGVTAANIGTVVVFPPYGLYLIGQAATRMAGYEPYTISDAIPEPIYQPVNVVYEGVTNAPGLMNSWVFGEQFKGKSTD